MNLAYYPGCTLKTKAKNLEEPAIASMKALGFELEEMPRWNCCGAVYSLADDDLIHQVAPVRNLIRVKKSGNDKLVTLCAFCLNTLKRANLLMKQNAEKRETLNNFIEEGINYSGEVKVLHLLEVLRDELGWEDLSRRVKVPLRELKIAPYYGCTLLRPREVAIDDVQNPTILHQFIKAIGATPLDFPESTRCCGSYQILNDLSYVLECALVVLSSAHGSGAEAIVTTCPLCEYNLCQAQKNSAKNRPQSEEMPIVYFTQLLALSLGLDPSICHFELNHCSPEWLLQSKKLLPEAKTLG